MGRFRSPGGATGRRIPSSRWLRRVLVSAVVIGALVPSLRAEADTALVLPASPDRSLVVLRVRIRPGLRIVTADLTMENMEVIDQVWCELWADNVETAGAAGNFHRVDRDAVLIGAHTSQDAVGVLHLEATVKSVLRFNVRVVCGHKGRGSAAVLLPGASLEVVDALSSTLVKGGVTKAARKAPATTVTPPVTAAPKAKVAATTAKTAATSVTTVAKKKAVSPTTTVARKKAVSPTTTVARKKAVSPTTTVAKKKAVSPSTTVAKKKTSVTTRP